MKQTKYSLNLAEKEEFLRRANQTYTEMKQDAQEWREYQEELALWDITLADGLDED
ncbi:MAG TPA: hypothetical protein VKU36_05860 [Candidatus Babeliales bacterium]|jgi:hypothetical protein|nr:hypothetical protein [Candidatus Babeliales bacterium]